MFFKHTFKPKKDFTTGVAFGLWWRNFSIIERLWIFAGIIDLNFVVFDITSEIDWKCFYFYSFQGWNILILVSRSIVYTH